MDGYERSKRLRDEYEAALDEAARLREAYHREVVKLHRSGASLREIAENLGISHQRVHQIVSPAEATPRRTRKKAGKAAVLGATLLLGASSGLLIGRAVVAPGSPNGALPSASPGVTQEASCRFPAGSVGVNPIDVALSCKTLILRLIQEAPRTIFVATNARPRRIIFMNPRTGEVAMLSVKGGSIRLPVGSAWTTSSP